MTDVDPSDLIAEGRAKPNVSLMSQADLDEEMYAAQKYGKDDSPRFQELQEEQDRRE